MGPRSSRQAWSLPLALAAAAAGCAGPGAAPSASATRAPEPRAAAAAVAPVGGDDCEEGPVTDDGGDGEPTTIDDGFEPPADGARAGAATPSPLADLSDEEIAAQLRADLGALGSISVGRTNGGALVSGVQMPEGASWHVVSPHLAWGTRETVDALAHAIDAVAARFPGSPKAFVGDISARHGGHLAPHISHQSGRDVDLGYYLTAGHRWYASATGSNLDRPRTWHLIRTLIADSDVELILVDRQIQRLLKAYAAGIGEDPAWLDDVFQVGGRSRRPLVFHVKGHTTHLHVRFYSPLAQELGRRAYRTLLARRIVSPPTVYVTHTVKPGETLGHLAARYKVAPDAIKRANALAGDVLRANRPYRIPQAGGIAIAPPAAIPPRRVPPPPRAVAAADSGGRECRRRPAP